MAASESVANAIADTPLFHFIVDTGQKPFLDESLAKMDPSETVKATGTVERSVKGGKTGTHHQSFYIATDRALYLTAAIEKKAGLMKREMLLSSERVPHDRVAKLGFINMNLVNPGVFPNPYVIWFHESDPSRKDGVSKDPFMTLSVSSDQAVQEIAAVVGRHPFDITYDRFPRARYG